MENTKEKKWIDLSILPRFGGESNKIKWNDCFNININFKFNEHEGTIHIIKPLPNKKILVEYKNKKYEIYRDDLRDCNLTYVVGNKSHEFKYNVGQKLKTRYGYVEILEQIYITRSNGYKIKGYIIHCLVCGDIFEIPESKVSVLNKESIICPVCRGDKIKIGFNDMWTTDPEKAKLLKNPEDGYKYMKSANKPKLEFICPYCETIIKKTPNEFDRDGGLCCPKCRESISYPNKYMFCLLRQLKIDFEDEKSFNWSDGKKYDFYIKDKNTIIEMHGIQHYEEMNFSKYGARTLKEEQENDKLKEKLAKENGIKNYIIIDCRKSNYNYITKNVLNSKLKNIIDLDNLDFTLLKQDAENPHVKLVSDLWNSGIHDIRELVKSTKIRRGRIHSILTRAKELGFCDYDSEETTRIAFDNALKTKYQIYSKPVFCNEYKFAFGNETILTNIFKDNFNIVLQIANVHKCLIGKRKSTCNLSFKYITKNEFNNYKDKFPDKSFGEYFEDNYINNK